ncbi:hypothetical protein BH23PLA1_BH23PLA1_40860 [soil metagenome]
MLSAFLALLLLGCFVVNDDPADLEKQCHQGTWLVVSFSMEGEETPSDVLDEIERVVDGERVVWYRQGRTFAATKTELDPTSDPPAIDVVPEGGPNREERILGIYKLEEDVLMICMAPAGADRPRNFDAEPGSGHTRMVFRRKPPEAEAEAEDDPGARP